MIPSSPSRRTVITGDDGIAAAVHHSLVESAHLSPRRSVFDPSVGPNSHLSQVPISDVPIKSTSTRRSSASLFPGLASVTFEMLPPITAQPPAEAQLHLVRKLRQCSLLFDFGNPTEALDAKEAKRETLLEIVHYVIACPNCLTAEVYHEIRKMIDANVCRPLHPKACPEGEEYDPEDNDIVEDPAWPHLHPVYELLLRVLESPNFSKKLAKDAFREEFALHLLKMFDSEDARERDYLKLAVHRMYGKCIHLRSFMKDQMGFILQDYTATQRPVSGIPEMLEILGSIVNGFAVPLKASNIDFLTQVLLPLVKMPLFVTYHSQLLYCLLHYLVKDPSLVSRVFRYIFRHWPVQVAKKQVLLLVCVGEMINSLDLQSLGAGAPYLLAHLAKTLQSPHFQVADKCFALLESDKMMNYARSNSAEVVKLLCPALQAVLCNHWNPQMQAAAHKLRKRLCSLNPAAAAEPAPVEPPVPEKWARLLALEKEPQRMPQRQASLQQLPSQLRPLQRKPSRVDDKLLSKHLLGHQGSSNRENDCATQNK